jgi:hypothetical protein
VKHRRKIVVDKNLKPYDPGPYPGDDDGFNDRSDTSRSVIHLRWSAEQGWRGSNGLAPPEPQLVIKAETVVRRWQNKLPTDKVRRSTRATTDLNIVTQRRGIAE